MQGLPAEEVSIGDYVPAGVSSRARADRCRDTPRPGRDREGGVPRARLVRGTRGARPPALHASARVPRDDGPRSPAFGRPRGDRALAARGAASRRRAGTAPSRLLAGGQWQGSTVHMRRGVGSRSLLEGLPSPTRSAEHHRAADTTVTRMLTSAPSPRAPRKGRSTVRRRTAGILPRRPHEHHRSRRAVLPAQRLPSFRPGDTVVHVRVVEGNRERAGVPGRRDRRSGGLRETFTVRKIPVRRRVARSRSIRRRSPSSEVAQRGHVRRAKLYYLRDLRGKKASIRERSTRRSWPRSRRSRTRPSRSSPRKGRWRPRGG